MGYYVVAFKSRSDTISFSEYLKSKGVFNVIVNTPKEAGVGCGLSVKPNLKIDYIKKAIRAFGVKSFTGVFSVTEKGGKKIVKPL